MGQLTNNIDITKFILRIISPIDVTFIDGVFSTEIENEADISPALYRLLQVITKIKNIVYSQPFLS